MPSYKIKPGQEHYTRMRGSGIQKHKAGAIIELTKSQAFGIIDKLELVAETKVEEAIRVSHEKEVQENLPKVEEVEDGGFNAINGETGAPINDEPLSQADAEALSENILKIKEVEKSKEVDLSEFEVED